MNSLCNDDDDDDDDDAASNYDDNNEDDKNDDNGNVNNSNSNNSNNSFEDNNYDDNTVDAIVVKSSSLGKEEKKIFVNEKLIRKVVTRAKPTFEFFSVGSSKNCKSFEIVEIQKCHLSSIEKQLAVQPLEKLKYLYFFVSLCCQSLEQCLALVAVQSAT